jgi:hypothetical protein
LTVAAESTSSAQGTASISPVSIVDGTLGLNTFAEILGLSCPKSGRCIAGGFDGPESSPQAFIASERNGVWGHAKKVDGVASLLRGGNSSISAVSCTSVGECSAGGLIIGNSASAMKTGMKVFTVDEVDGVWGKAHSVKGMPTTDMQAPVIRCSRSGFCVGYSNPSLLSIEPPSAPYVFDEVNGAWSRAQIVPGLSKLPGYKDAPYASKHIASFSCSADGSCAIVGTYESSLTPVNRWTAFTDEFEYGAWQDAATVTTNIVASKASSFMDSVGCDPNGDCVAAGTIFPVNFEFSSTLFVIGGSNGQWSNAIFVKVLKGFGLTQIVGIYCQSEGSCNVIGTAPEDGVERAFLLTLRNGSWSGAIFLPKSFGTQPIAGFSCSTVKYCGAVGTTGKFGIDVAYLIINGKWAERIPFPTTFDSSGAKVQFQFSALSCRESQSCIVGGHAFYVDNSKEQGAAIWSF